MPIIRTSCASSSRMAKLAARPWMPAAACQTCYREVRLLILDDSMVCIEGFSGIYWGFNEHLVGFLIDSIGTEWDIN